MKMNTGTVTLETERLILRQFTMDDLPAVHRNWTTDPDVTKYLTWRAFSEEYETRLLLHDWCNAYRYRDFYRWAVVLKSLGEPVGTVSMMRTANPFTFETGYCFGKNWWGQGIAAEALNAITEHMFLNTPCTKIFAKFAVENEASGRVLEKCGFTLARKDTVKAVTENGVYRCRLYEKRKNGENP